MAETEHQDKAQDKKDSIDWGEKLREKLRDRQEVVIQRSDYEKDELERRKR